MVSLDRDTRIDTLRGLGIIVIIFGHINFEPIGSQIISIFYLFNVPFFSLSLDIFGKRNLFEHLSPSFSQDFSHSTYHIYFYS